MIKEYNKIAIITEDEEITYSQLLMHINRFSQFTPKGERTKCIIFSENRKGWIYAFFSVWQNKGIAIPVDATSTVDDLAYIIKDCSPEFIWTSVSRANTANEAIKKAGASTQVLLIDEYESREAQGAKAKIEFDKNDTAVLIYTSGTTGSPKGVMLSFSNLYSNMAGVVDEVPIFNSQRRTLMLLPVHHILPLMGTIVIPLITGDGIAICPSLSGPDIMKTLCKGEVGIMIGVPRLWQTLYSGIKKKIDEKAVTRALFTLCEKVGSKRLSRFIFQSVHKKMGGHLMYCVSGGAALDKEIGEGLRTLGINVLEGYGMTETSPIIAFTRPDDIIPGCVGKPLPSVECKIVNGELLAKGPNVMQGYYNRPEETASVLDSDGYIHTGDLAEIDSEGRIRITGRTKEIIVLSNGKNVQPNEIEYKLEKYDEYIKEAAITERNDMLVAIIVPQQSWAEGKTTAEIEQQLKRLVIEPYNLTVENYKKVMKIFVYEGDLPRTKLEKLQRFKLKDILDGKAETQADAPMTDEPTFEEYLLIKKFIEQEKRIPVCSTSHFETDIAMDSLDKVSLQGFIENTFGMQIELDELMQLATVGNLASHVAQGKTQINTEDVDWKKIFNQKSSHLSLPVCSWTHPLMSSLFTSFFKVYNNLSVKGRENIPLGGPYIIAPNHQSYIDGPLVMSGLTREELRNSYFYATENHVKSSLARHLASRHNVVIMERRDLKNSIMRLAEVLKKGKNVVIFPEGHRSEDGKLGEFKKTFAILSKELNVPIIPVRISGAYDALSRKNHLIRPVRLSVEYLPKIDPTGYGTYEEITDAVKNAIAEDNRQ